MANKIFGRFCFLSLLGTLAASVLAIGIRTADSHIQATAGITESGEPIGGLKDSEHDLHVRGRRLFRWELWRPDRSAAGFNATECSKCHLEPTFGGSGRVREEFAAFVPDQTANSGWKAYHRLQRQNDGRFARAPLPARAEVRRAPSLFGAGLLELVPDFDLNNLADPEDANGDGISGRRLKVGDKFGRFGWKASIASLEAFVIEAFKTEMGISISPFEPDDFEGLGMSQIKAVSFYVRTLSPPRSKPLGTSATRAAAIFDRIDCARCHVPELRTGASGTQALDRKRIRVYTDLLLHEMGDSRSLHITSGKPSETEFRTPPLWGLGEFGGPYWHDGSADTIEAAVLKHGGEAKGSRDKYRALSGSDRKLLLEFLAGL